MDSLRIHAVTFDVGGTLIEPHPSVGAIYAAAAERNGGKGISSQLLNQRFTRVWQSLSGFNYSRQDWAALVDSVFDGLTPAPPSQTFFDQLYDDFAQPTAWRIFDDVLPALETLASRGIKLGVISNWDDRLPPLLRRLHLHSYFDAIVVSCEIGFCKPSPVIFEHAAAKLALPPAAILHVGDNVQTDLAGAHSAGFRSIELRRNGSDSQRRPGSLPGYVVSLRQVIEFANTANAAH